MPKRDLGWEMKVRQLQELDRITGLTKARTRIMANIEDSNPTNAGLPQALQRLTANLARVQTHEHVSGLVQAQSMVAANIARSGSNAGLVEAAQRLAANRARRG